MSFYLKGEASGSQTGEQRTYGICAGIPSRNRSYESFDVYWFLYFSIHHGQNCPTSIWLLIEVAESLRNHLKLDDLPLATTDEGRKFTMKALHPSDSSIRSARVPGRNMNTVSIAIDHVFDVPVGAEGWVDINLIPHPLAPVGCYNDTGTWIFYSPPFGGGVLESSDYTACTNKMTTVATAFLNLIEQYCITSQSVTCELIAPSTASQGTVIACQYANPCQAYTWEHTSYGFSRGAAFEIDPIPSVMAAGARAYSAKAIDGVYMPLRLEDFRQHSVTGDWVSKFNMVDGELPRNYTKAITDRLVARPYYMDPSAGVGGYSFMPTQANWGKIAFRGCSPSASIRVRARQTLEVVVDPESSYAPLAEAPIAPDDLALRMYVEISARMKDAYPASYNDWETLKKTILSIGKKVLPYVSPALSLVTSGLPFGGAINSLGQAALDGLNKKLGVTAAELKKGQSYEKAMATALAVQTRAERRAAAKAASAAQQAAAAATKAANAANAASSRKKLNIQRPSAK